jgi:hypothetical protein
MVALNIFGQLEELIADDLYPYRVPITIALATAAVLAVVLAYRAGWHLVAWRHKLITAVAAVAVLAVAIPAGDYFLSPLWERSFLEEPSPLVSSADDPSAGPADPVATPSPDAATPPPAPTAPPTFEPRVTQRGEFHGADDFHFGRGTALLIETAPGVYTLRFEEFSVRNGPDLYVYLSTSADGFGDGSLELGRLKATDGAFNYEVPPGTDLSRFQSAVVWCKQFSVLFATAPFSPA